MSDSLANLFSGSSPPPARLRTPSPPPSEPLFLSPSDTPARRVQPGASGSRPAYDVAEGGSRPAQASSAERPNGGPSVPDFDWAQLNGMDAGVPFVDPLAIEDDQPVKKRRVVAKIDEERLMGPNGFPALMRAAKKFKVRGKTREAEDLRELLSMYQMWAHGMFPKGDFQNTIAKVETMCRKRRMESAMKGYRDAFYPPPPQTPSPPGSPHSAQPNEGDEHNDIPHDWMPDGARSLPSSEPLFGPADDDDGPDMDELMAMEEMEHGQTARPEVAGPAGDDDWDLYD